jgi:hypothetical protein
MEYWSDGKTKNGAERVLFIAILRHSRTPILPAAWQKA